MKIEIDNKIIEYNVEYGNRKRLSIHIDPIGLITIKVPKNTNEEIVIGAIEQKSRWILNKLSEISKAREIFKTKEYHAKGKFFYLGKEYFLDQLIETSALGEEELKKSLKKFYSASCKKIVGERIKIYEKQLGVKPKTIEIVESKSHWGSCSSDKKITFNYRLAMAPIDVIDYVIIHELCHLIHMNHDRSFWRRVGSVISDYKEKQAFLVKYGRYMTL